MKTTVRMKPAINIAETKTSIHDVIDNNPLFLNKVTSIYLLWVLSIQYLLAQKTYQLQ